MKNWNEIIKKLSMLGWFQECLSTLDVNVLQRKIFFKKSHSCIKIEKICYQFIAKKNWVAVPVSEVHRQDTRSGLIPVD